jgi:2-polyprenyl-3-methyl-5-hydroxy-6-metoxy-1,4-benzoquinol methylase
MNALLDAVRSGHYAKKQIHSRSALISWSHRGRFATGLRLAKEVGGARVLDYGCGDGTFLAFLLQSESAEAEASALRSTRSAIEIAVGAEVNRSLVDDCRQRFAGRAELRFELVDDLNRPDVQGSFDTIYCMEVFEHVVEPAPILDRLHRLLAPGGALVISVPIETGLPVIVKQVVRRVAGWRGIGHYPGTTGYTPMELVLSVFAGSSQHIPRPVFANQDGSTFHDHKGFNWRVLRELITERFDLIRQTTSPFGAVGPQFGTQRWFIARKI